MQGKERRTLTSEDKVVSNQKHEGGSSEVKEAGDEGVKDTKYEFESTILDALGPRRKGRDSDSERKRSERRLMIRYVRVRERNKNHRRRKGGSRKQRKHAENKRNETRNDDIPRASKPTTRTSPRTSHLTIAGGKSIRGDTRRMR